MHKCRKCLKFWLESGGNGECPSGGCSDMATQLIKVFLCFPIKQKKFFLENRTSDCINWNVCKNKNCEGKRGAICSKSTCGLSELWSWSSALLLPCFAATSTDFLLERVIQHSSPQIYRVKFGKSRTRPSIKAFGSTSTAYNTVTGLANFPAGTMRSNGTCCFYVEN